MYLPGKNRQLCLIFEIGSFATRVGYSGQGEPTLIQPSDVGFFEDSKQMQQLEFSAVQGSRADKIINPYKNDFLENLEIMEFSIQNSIQNQLHSRSEELNCFIVEQPIHNKELRSRMVEMIFEKIGMKGLYFNKSPILSSYIFAKENILLVESGANYTYCVPIIEGQLNNKVLLKLNMAGETMTKKLFKILNDRKPINPRYKNAQSLSQDILEFGKLEVVREIKQNMCKTYDSNIENLKFNPSVDNTMCQLPDKSLIEISQEIYTVPEIMFQEEEELNFKGIPELIYEVITKIQPDLRRELIQNIVFLGGNSLMSGTLDRLQKEIFELQLNGLETRSKVFSATGYIDQHHSAWLGASIMASMSTFDSMVMTKEDYNEHGSLLIERKCMH